MVIWRFFVIFSLCNCFISVLAETLQWEWHSGRDNLPPLGVYGTQGIASPENVPGARSGSVAWYDTDRLELWLFGGRLASGEAGMLLNDLWRYRVNDSTWTWVSGSNTPNRVGVYGTINITSEDNMPGARERAVGLYDPSRQELLLFGGNGYASSSGSSTGLLNDLWRYRVNDNTWTWISGSDSIDQPGVYNHPNEGNHPGARQSAVGWCDSSTQELWLFGGAGYDKNTIFGKLNDLWGFKLNDLTWSWISGSDTADQRANYGEQGVGLELNVPGARSHAVGWYDSSTQDLWLFGGDGYDEGTSGSLNDLWRYRVNESTWTWISGYKDVNKFGQYGEKGIANASNVPGARQGAVGWFDSLRQALWLFGGLGYHETSTGYFNDLWVYQVNSNTWTWISGSNTVDQRGVYGVKGTIKEENTPGARADAIGWFDSTLQYLWLFGGNGIASRSFGYLNDLWRYQVNDSTWTWISGSDFSGKQFGVYGTQGIPSRNNIPGARQFAFGAFDSIAQELWLFGGLGYAETSPQEGLLNDLWRYRMNDSTWTWMSGSNTIDQRGVYGELGVYTPGARQNAMGWYDSNTQELWLFGGNGFGTDISGLLNDLWRYRVNDSTWTWISGSSAIDQHGVYGNQGIGHAINVPGARLASVGWYDGSRQEFWLFGGYGVDAENLRGFLNDLWRFQVNESTWTWISGSDQADPIPSFNYPNARAYAVGWYDSNTRVFWLFGGRSDFSTVRNDLWSYQVNESTWTYIFGSNSSGTLTGVYREKGVPSVESSPGGRCNAVGWYDSSTQELWLFGGEGFGKTPLSGKLNDLWRFRVNETTWTWISGSDTVNQPGVYGEQGVGNTANVPGARYGALGWYDSSTQELWLLGGVGYGSRNPTSSKELLNDIWKASWVVEPEEPKCPPLHERIDDECLPIVDCASDNSSCVVQCNSQQEPACLVEGDIIFYGDIEETKNVNIIGSIDITGNVTLVGYVTVKLQPGAMLNVGKCLILDDTSSMVIMVDEESKLQTVLATYDKSCSSPELLARVSIETASSLDVCTDGRPNVVQQEEEGRARLELLFVPINDLSECSRENENKLNIVAISVGVAIGVLALIAIIVVLAVPKLRHKVFPYAGRSGNLKRATY